MINKSHEKELNSIKQWLLKHSIFNYTIEDELVVNVHQDVYINNKELKQISVQFGHVEGEFHCNNNFLTSLKGCPRTISKDFHCGKNYLTSLEYGPEMVGGDYLCYKNDLTSLEFIAKTIGGELDCSRNKISTLKFCPESVARHFDISENPVNSLDGFNTKIGTKLYFSSKSFTILMEHFNNEIIYPVMELTGEQVKRLQNSHNLYRELHDKLMIKNSAENKKNKI